MFISCAKPAVEKNVGLQLWSVRDHMKTNPDSTIMELGKMGYKFVEAAGYSDGKFYGMAPADFKALVEKSGMKFYGSHAGQALPDSAHWDSTMMWWDQAIAAHKEAGVKWIVQPFMDAVGYESLDGLKKYCDYFNAVGEKCNAAGIRFGYHNHDKEFGQIDSTVRYDFMLQNTDSSKVMFQMDLYWATVGGAKPTEYFEKYPGRFMLWHVKDEKELGGADSMMDFAPIFAEAEKAGMKYYIVEVERYSMDPLESVKKSIEFLQNAPFVTQ
ncbi:MAG: sugar phosphate isomerase/epimerase [Bacteroidales bacterium]|nr:sugar phosphate isomerase/epimerase [Bacteroidales bacterium]